jgi:hypothetical protein
MQHGQLLKRLDDSDEDIELEREYTSHDVDPPPTAAEPGSIKRMECDREYG